MKKNSRYLWALLLALLPAAALLHSQSASSPVQQAATMLNAATKVADCNVAINTVCTATATPAAGNYVYITGIDLAVCGNGTGTVQTNVTWTTTGLTGSPILWAYSTAINPTPARTNLSTLRSR